MQSPAELCSCLQIQPLLAPGNGGAHNPGHQVTVSLSVRPLEM